MRDRTPIFLVAAAAILALLALAGCGKDRIRTQAAADALEGAKALRVVAMNNGIAPEALAVMDAIIPGIRLHVLASRGLTRPDELPPPQLTAPEIAADPEPYSALGVQAVEAAKTAGWWVVIGGGILTALGFAMRNGLFGPVGNWVAGLVTPIQMAREQIRLGNLAGAAQTFMAVAENAPPEIAQPIKRAVDKALTPEQWMAVHAYLEAQGWAGKSAKAEATPS
jgi:hypothetical protein